MKRNREVIAEDAMGRVVRETMHPETAQEFSQLFAKTPPSLPEALSGLKEWLNGELQKSGWPPVGQKVWYDNRGKWHLVAPGEAPANPDWGGAWSEIFVRDQAEPLSRDYFLALVALEIRRIEYYPAEGANREGAIFCYALSIGEHLRELELRRAVLPAVNTGRRVLRGNAAGRDEANRVRKKEKLERVRHWQSEANKVWAKYPDRSATAVAKFLKEKLRIEMEIDTISRSLKKPRKAV